MNNVDNLNTNIQTNITIYGYYISRIKEEPEERVRIN